MEGTGSDGAVGPADGEASAGRVRVRKADTSDAQALSKVARDSIQGLEWLRSPQRRAWLEATGVEAVSQALQTRTWLTWMATADEAVSGFVTLDGNIVRMHHVAAGSQGQGIGSRLLEVAERAALAMDLTHVTVRAPPAAGAFYKARGFKVQAVEAGTLGDAPFPVVVLRKRLAD